MTCIKTGARVLFVDYGYVLAADIFTVENAIVVHANMRSKSFYGEEDATHEIACPMRGGNEFWRDDIGVFVVPAANFLQLKEKQNGIT